MKKIKSKLPETVLITALVCLFCWNESLGPLPLLQHLPPAQLTFIPSAFVLMAAAFYNPKAELLLKKKPFPLKDKRTKNIEH